jgi:hypothetical protein
VWQHGAWGGGAAQLEASLSLHYVLCFADQAIHSAQVHKARAEAEAAAEQRLAAALARERAELDKQVQLMLFVQQCGSALPGLVLRSVDALDDG